MKRLLPIIVRYGSCKQSPIVKQIITKERISQNKIIFNIQQQRLTHQLINNLTIAINCTKIAIKYSKCYLCRFPFIKSSIRTLYGMSEDQKILKDVKNILSAQIPIKQLQSFFPKFSYENKGLYSSLSLLLDNSKMPKQQYKKTINFLTALECVNLGFTLHYSIGKSYKLNILTRIILKLMSKKMKDSYLVLAGDFFHIKGSVLAAETQSVQLSKMLSEVEINLSKYIHLTDGLRRKIMEEGYDKVQINEIFNVSLLKISPLVKGLMSLDLIKGKDENQLKEAYEYLSLMVLYRKDLQNFMFNFKDILKKYMQYRTNRINMDFQESLPYYIFFKGAYENQRIDTAYLNTVTMMNQQIQFLKGNLEKKLGKQKMQFLQKRMNYFMMVHL